MRKDLDGEPLVLLIGHVFGAPFSFDDTKPTGAMICVDFESEARLQE